MALTNSGTEKNKDRGMRIGSIRLLEKQGGRSGHWTAEPAE